MLSLLISGPVSYTHLDVYKRQHTSYANEHRLLKISHNERLEFLGDAVLQLIISEYLFEKYPKRPEGDLTKLRSTIVREESLAGFSRDCQFDLFIKLGKGEEKSGEMCIRDRREAGYRVAQSRSIDDVAYQLVEAYRKVLEM